MSRAFSGFGGQLRALAQESFNKKQDLVMLISAAVISLLAGYVIRSNMFQFYENAKIGFFIIVCCAMWMGMFDSILCICDKRAILERDKASGLHPVSFVLACVVYQAFHSLLQTLVMCIVTWALVDWPTGTVPIVGPVPFEYFLTIFLVTFCSQMLGLGVSAIMKTSERALTFAPFLLIYELIMSETIFGLPSWLEPLRNTTIVRWGLNALGTVFNIDALPWKAESKISDVLGYVANDAGNKVSSMGIDPSTLTNYITNYQVDPSIMGVNHNLSEYLATAANIDTAWLWLAGLALIGIIIAIIGFVRRMDMR